MTVSPHLVAEITSAADGRIVGRIRIQKMVYLLDQLGFGSGASYYYHHYGPYSDDVSNAIADAKFYGLISEEVSYRQSDGAPFSIFNLGEQKIEHKSEMDVAQVTRLIGMMNKQSSTVLELAATIHWLAKVEKIGDWREELKKRKGAKAEAGRVDAAGVLLGELGLAI